MPSPPGYRVKHSARIPDRISGKNDLIVTEVCEDKTYLH
jgi:hypothetical protein